jgi:hypothetical protein
MTVHAAVVRAAVQQCAAVRECTAVWQCAAVRQCVAVRTEVCGSAHGSVWQCARQCAAESAHGSVWQCAQQCVAVRTVVCAQYARQYAAVRLVVVYVIARGSVCLCGSTAVCLVRQCACVSARGSVWQCVAVCGSAHGSNYVAANGLS